MHLSLENPVYVRRFLNLDERQKCLLRNLFLNTLLFKILFLYFIYPENALEKRLFCVLRYFLIKEFNLSLEVVLTQRKNHVISPQRKVPYKNY